MTSQPCAIPAAGVFPAASDASSAELHRCTFSGVLLRAYRFRRLRQICLRSALRFEGGGYFSWTARAILANYHDVQIGAYSYGECLIPGAFPPGVRVGRYVSIAAGVRPFLRNHPYTRLSMHPFFYNSALGLVDRDTIETGTLSIEHDAWIGERAIITPGCHRIGIGAVVGAGAVITKDVPDFAIVAGNPARLLKWRFPEAIQDAVRSSRWWERTMDQCMPHLDLLVQPLGERLLNHPLLQGLGPL